MDVYAKQTARHQTGNSSTCLDCNEKSAPGIAREAVYGNYRGQVRGLRRLRRPKYSVASFPDMTIVRQAANGQCARTARGPAAFTLVEMMVAVAILGIVGVSICGDLSQSRGKWE